MKKLKLEGSNEIVYYDKLSNGLEVYLYSKENYHNNYVTFTTKFGSVYKEFIPIDSSDMISVPNGVAHFLEHKVFVQEKDPQPDDFFANNGAICNAYTTFKNTTYLFSGSGNLKENINYLLDFVQKPYFTDENVDSEKGIITQEIHMCDDRPTDILYETIRRNTLSHNHFRESIIGTVKDINSITKETLDTCYKSFYHPANMFLVVTGNFNPEEILETIKANQNNKKFAEFKEIEVKEEQEPDEVVKKEETIKINTDIAKVSYNIKINPDKLGLDKRKINLYLFIIFSILFDDSSIFEKEAKEEGIITNSISINLLNCDSHILLSLINETNKSKELLEKIKETLKNIKIDKSSLERKKKVLISNELFSFENIEVINEMIIDNIIFDNNLATDSIPMIRELNIDELNELISKLDLENYSIVVLESE